MACGRAVVVAAHYRQAPEFRFPTAYEDARAAWAWMTSHAESLGGDAARTAIAGEDAGANLALDLAIQLLGRVLTPWTRRARA